MGFSEAVKIQAMVACGRCCCLCHTFCGTNIELHHIKAEADDGSDSFENAIPLCFNCHAIVRQYDPRHPKGTKFSEKELIQHRNNWYASIKEGRAKSSVKTTPAIERLRIIRNKESTIMLQRVVTGRELMALVSDVSAMEYSYDDPDTQEVAIILADFIQGIRELIDCCDFFMEPSDSVMTAFELTGDLKKLEDTGYWLFCGIDKRTVVGEIGNPEPFPTLIVKIVRSNSDEIIKYDEASMELL